MIKCPFCDYSEESSDHNKLYSHVVRNHETVNLKKFLEWINSNNNSKFRLERLREHMEIWLTELWYNS